MIFVLFVEVKRKRRKELNDGEKLRHQMKRNERRGKRGKKSSLRREKAMICYTF